jgi:hypothetical protein
MKRSNDTFNRSSIALKRPALRSANSGTERFSRAAVCTIFSPCSSVPVRKNTSLPLSRWKRASASVAIASYAWPMCGTPFGYEIAVVR